MTSRLRTICPHCRSIVPARQTCPVCRAGSEANRNQAQPYRAAYRHSSYKRNRAKRYLLAGGRCEVCGIELKGSLHPHGVKWESDHVTAARLFADVEHANAIENLRVLCVPCHRVKGKR